MKKKVLFLITKSNWGGAQRYVYDLATNLDRERYQPVVALGGVGDLQQKLTVAGVRVIPLEHMGNTLSPSKLITSIKEVQNLLVAERPDVLHSNSSIAGVAGVVAGRLCKTPNIVFTAHGWAFNENRPTIQKVIFWFFYWLTVLFSHTTIAVSHTIIRQLRAPGVGKKWVVVHNGRQAVDYVDRLPARTHLHLPTDPNITVTGTIGELHSIKQHDVMIKAVAQLRSAGQSVHHVIIGTGQERDNLERLVRDLQLTDNITFTGAIPEAAQYLKAIDIYIQPSRSEALAYTVIEAAQAGLPIVASRVGGIPEIITHRKDGLLVTHSSVGELTNAITTLITRPDERTRLATAATTRGQDFGFAKMLSKTTAIYEDNIPSSSGDTSLDKD